jgi:ABC-2 type transport system permease protein
MKRYLKLWFLYSLFSTQTTLDSRFGAILFTIGKILRFGLFFAFIYIIVSSVKNIAGYSFWQLIFVFATFNLVDITSQLFLREVYRFRGYVTSGSLDYFLIRPMSPVFRFLFGGSDILDVPLFIISVIFLFVSLFQIGGTTLSGAIVYLALIINGFFIALSFHLFVLAVGILTTEVDNSLWLYRDITAMGRIPVSFYTQPVQSIITFVIPVGIMITFPAEAIFGRLPIQLLVISFIVGVLFLALGTLSWKFAIKRYASASS